MYYFCFISLLFQFYFNHAGTIKVGVGQSSDFCRPGGWQHTSPIVMNRTGPDVVRYGDKRRLIVFDASFETILDVGSDFVRSATGVQFHLSPAVHLRLVLPRVFEYSWVSISGCKFLFQVAVFCSQLTNFAISFATASLEIDLNICVFAPPSPPRT